MHTRWVKRLTFATAILWLVIGIDGLRRGDIGFVPVAATLTGALGLIATWLDKKLKT